MNHMDRHVQEEPSPMDMDRYVQEEPSPMDMDRYVQEEPSPMDRKNRPLFILSPPF